MRTNMAIVDGLGVVYCALQRRERLDIPMSVYELAYASVHESLSIGSTWAAVYRVRFLSNHRNLKSVLCVRKYKNIVNTDNTIVLCLCPPCMQRTEADRGRAPITSPMRQFC